MKKHLAIVAVSLFAVACSPDTGRDSVRSGSGSQAAAAASSADPNSFQVQPTEQTVAGATVLRFIYPTTRAARLVAANISDDGMRLGTADMNWKGSPHFFRKENVMVLYVGNEQKVLDELKVKFGEQFAGK